jgi:uncharacterized membrane protein (DUF485 family)
VEWTLDTRPMPLQLAAIEAPSVATPALESAGAGGVDPMGGIGSFSGAASGPTTGDVASDFSAFILGGNPAPTQQQERYKVDASWYDATRGPAAMVAPTNGQSTAGLVLSLLGLSIFGIIFSAIGLRRARDFEAGGQPPVGRERGHWGLGLGITAVVLNIVISVTYVLFAPQIISSLQDFVQAQSAQTGEPNGGTPDDVTVLPVQSEPIYVRADYEQAIYDAYLEAGEQMPDGVLCPTEASTAVGSSVTCQVVIGLSLYDRTSTYFADGSVTTETVEAVQQ